MAGLALILSALCMNATTCNANASMPSNNDDLQFFYSNGDNQTINLASIEQSAYDKSMPENYYIAFCVTYDRQFNNQHALE